MDIYAYLKEDHTKVIHLMDQVLAARSDARRHTLFADIRHELLLHVQTEQMTFYAALQSESETEERIEDAKDDHTEIEEYLDQLSKLRVSHPKWLEVFGEFRHAVEHHVKDEEERIFEKARKLLSHQEAERLAADMDGLKHKSMEKAA